jgi:hypothetical protein
MRNLAHDPVASPLRDELDGLLREKLDRQGDEFLPGMDYMEQYGYCADETGTVPYTD